MLVTLAATAAGCSSLFQPAPPSAPAPAGAAAWPLVPLPPDPALTAAAERPGSTCLQVGGPLPKVKVQDRRAVDSVSFILTDGTTVVGCNVNMQGLDLVGGGGSSGTLRPATGKVTQDTQGGGSFNGGPQHGSTGGRADPSVARVVVQLPDGRLITSSMANGWWLASWIGNWPTARIIAFDAFDNVVGTIENPK